jgi:hypothetical protein
VKCLGQATADPGAATGNQNRVARHLHDFLQLFPSPSCHLHTRDNLIIMSVR